MSAFYTSVAIGIGMLVFRSNENSYWFSISEKGIQPNEPTLLASLNYPFDLFTIIISITLLKWVVTKGKWITIIATIDIAISAILSIILHTIFKVIEPSSKPLVNCFLDSFHWFIDIVSFQASPRHSDWSLTPLLLTTFIPVAVYMSIFIFLGFIVKPFARMAGYICGLLGEKEKTPFFELAVALSLFIILFKSLSNL